jgi:hypothetical protein
MVHHNVNTDYGENNPVLLSSSSSPFPITPLSKPPYPNQHHPMNLHDVSAYDFLQAHVHELETEAVPDDTIIEDSSVDGVDPEPPNILHYKAEKGSPPTPFLLVIFVESCPSIQSNQSNFLMLIILYPTLKPHLDNPCPSLIAVRMEVLLVMMFVSSLKLDAE